MREIDEQLKALEGLEDIVDEEEKDRARAAINARIRAALRSNPDSARTFLQNIPICDSEQAFVAMAMVEALAVHPDDDNVHLLGWYFDVAAKKVEECPDDSYAVQVLTSYVFLEDGSGARKFDILPRYLALTRSPVAQLRRAAVELLLGFDAASAPGVRDELVRLLQDPDSQVRRAAEDLLREEGVLPDGYRPSS